MPKKKPFIIAVDFDGTLVEDDFPNIGEPKPLFYQLKKLATEDSSIRIILWTCREGDYLAKAVSFLVKNDFPLHAVNRDIPETRMWRGRIRNGEVSSKVFANMYIDDRATFYNSPHKDIFRGVSFLNEAKLSTVGGDYDE